MTKALDGGSVIPWVWLTPEDRCVCGRDPELLVRIRAGDVSPCDAQLTNPKVTMRRVELAKKCPRWSKCEDSKNRRLCIQKFGLTMVQKLLKGGCLAYELHDFLSAEGLHPYDWIAGDLTRVDGQQEAARHVMSFVFQLLKIAPEAVDSMAPPSDQEKKYAKSRYTILTVADALAALDNLTSHPSIGDRVEFWPPVSDDPSEQREMRAMEGIVVEIRERVLREGEDEAFGAVPILVIEVGSERHERSALDVVPLSLGAIDDEG